MTGERNDKQDKKNFILPGIIISLSCLDIPASAKQAETENLYNRDMQV